MSACWRIGVSRRVRGDDPGFVAQRFYRAALTMLSRFSAGREKSEYEDEDEDEDDWGAENDCPT